MTHDDGVRNDRLRIARAREWNWSALLDRHAHELPDAVALRFQGRSWTFRDLRAEVDVLADSFAAAGIGAGDRVAVVLLNRPEYLLACIAACEIGAVVVPVNFRLAPWELAYLLDDSAPGLVVTENRLLPLVAAAVGQGAARPVLNVDEGLAQGRPERRRELTVFPDGEPAFIFYTSGTTGHPKGAVLSYRNLRAQADQLAKAWRLNGSGDGTVGIATPLFHIAGLAMCGGPLAIGGTLALQPLQNFDPVATVEAVERDGISALFLVPAQWQAMVAVPGVENRMRTLRVAAWGAAPAPVTLLDEMAKAFPGATIVAHFGQTEMAPNTCILFADDARRKVGSVGRPVDSVQMRIVDERGNDVPPGQVGEAVYRGLGTMLEYWNDPESTAEAFAGGWFHSGDLVRADDEGFVYVVDRKKDMIITGGENVYSAEVENAVATHPSVLEVAVVGRPDQQWGEVVVACIALRPGAGAPSVDELATHLHGRLAHYKRPREVQVLDALPRNATGKLLKRALKQPIP